MHGYQGIPGKAVRWAVAVVCLVAMLVMAAPCAMGDASTPHCSTPQMSGMCCPDASASRTCCEMHQKPAAVGSMPGTGEVVWRAEATCMLPAGLGWAKAGLPVRETLTPSPPRQAVLRI